MYIHIGYKLASTPYCCIWLTVGNTGWLRNWFASRTWRRRLLIFTSPLGEFFLDPLCIVLHFWKYFTRKSLDSYRRSANEIRSFSLEFSYIQIQTINVKLPTMAPFILLIVDYIDRFFLCSSCEVDEFIGNFAPYMRN